MLQLSGNLSNRPILSVRSGAQIATAIDPIINPNNLKVVGWYCQDRFSKEPLILRTQEIRDMIPQGIIVDDLDALSEPEELIRLKEIIDLAFVLISKPVITVNKERLGKVSDYATDNLSLYVQKLYISQPIYKSLSSGSLTIDRSQIVEITNRKIVVYDPVQKVRHDVPYSIPAAS